MRIRVLCGMSKKKICYIDLNFFVNTIFTYIYDPVYIKIHRRVKSCFTFSSALFSNEIKTLERKTTVKRMTKT